MRELLGLVATFIEAGTAAERHPTRTVLVVVATTIAALCAIGTVICLLTALWLYEMPILGEVGAPLVVAAVLAAATLIAGVILHARTLPPPPPPPHPLVTGAAVVSTLMRSHKTLILLGALLAGFVASESERK
jgi:hypothetical protein